MRCLMNPHTSGYCEGLLICAGFSAAFWVFVAWLIAQ